MALGALVAGCDPSDAELRLDGVFPDQVHFGAVNSVVTLQGRFVPRLALVVGEDSGSTRLEDSFSVRVGELDIPRKDIKLLSTGELQVTLPPLEIGPDEETPYSIKVTDPRGFSQELTDTLKVVIREPTQVVMVNPPTVVPVDAWTSPIRVEFRDAEGYQARFAKRQVSVRISTDSPTGLISVDVGNSSGANDLQYLLQAATVGFDFVYRDPMPGDSRLTVSVDGLQSWPSTLKVGERSQPAQVKLTGDLTASAGAGDTIPLMLEVQDATGEPATLPPGGVFASFSVAFSGGITDPEAATAGAGLATDPNGPFNPSLQAVIPQGSYRLPVYFRGTRASTVEITARIVEARSGTQLAVNTFKFNVMAAAPVPRDGSLEPALRLVPGEP